MDSLVRENHKEFLKNNNLVLKSQHRFRSEKHKLTIQEYNQSVQQKLVHTEQAKT